MPGRGLRLGNPALDREDVWGCRVQEQEGQRPPTRDSTPSTPARHGRPRPRIDEHDVTLFVVVAVGELVSSAVVGPTHIVPPSPVCRPNDDSSRGVPLLVVILIVVWCE